MRIPYTLKSNPVYVLVSNKSNIGKETVSPITYYLISSKIYYGK